METKICTQCKTEKSLNLFAKSKYGKLGLRADCTECFNKKHRNKKPRNEFIPITEKQCTLCNQTKPPDSFNTDKNSKDGKRVYCKDCSKTLWKNFVNSGKYKEYKDNNKKLINLVSKDYIKTRRSNETLFKLIGNMRNRLYKAFKGLSKNKNTEALLGCSFDFAKEHIESKFQSGMTWDNYGEWHIDHKVPLSLAKNEQELEYLCHYSNLQPLWAKDNLIKGSKVF